MLPFLMFSIRPATLSRSFSVLICGMRAIQDDTCFWIDGDSMKRKRPNAIEAMDIVYRYSYIDQIVNKYCFIQAAPVKTPLDKDIKLARKEDYTADPKFRTEYQSKVGSPNFGSNQTRPDIAFATCYVARYRTGHIWTPVDRIFSYLK